MNGLRSFYSRARNRALLTLDGLLWRRSLTPLRRAARPERQGYVLFCDLLVMRATAKVESLLAGTLRLKGLAPLVLLRRRDPLIEAVFRAASNDAQIIYLSDYLERVSPAAAREKADRIINDAASLQSIVDYEEDGYRIGRNALSWALRQLRVGRLEDKDLRHRETIGEALAQSFMTKDAVERLLSEWKPRHAVFVERGYTPAGEVFDGCLLHGVDTIQWLSAPQSDSLIYKRYDLQSRGDHPLSISANGWERLKALPWSDEMDSRVVERIESNYETGAWYNRQQLQEGKALLSPEAVRRELGLDPSRKTAVIFAHILYDATFFYGESLFADYEEWLVESVRCAIDNPNLNWIVKVHPVNVWRSRMDRVEMEQLEARALRKAFGDLPPHIRLMPADTGINTYSLFKTIDYGLTVRGTIGMELPCFGIPVVTAGTGRYSGLGFTIDPATSAEFSATLAQLHKVEPLGPDTMRLARRYYYGALALRPLPMKSFVLDYDANTFGLDALKQNVILPCSPNADVLSSQDLGKIVEWATEGQQGELFA